MKESTMKTAKHLSILISAIVILSTLSSPAHARFKCWTNNEGIKECGEKVPPEYAQKGHQEMSTQGMVLEKKDRAKNFGLKQKKLYLVVICFFLKIQKCIYLICGHPILNLPKAVV